MLLANKNSRFVNCDIVPLIEPIEKNRYYLYCLYENSCGAAVYRIINGKPRFLLIKNKRVQIGVSKRTYGNWKLNDKPLFEK